MEARVPDAVQPRVSVIMPTFNQATFIRRAIDSLRGQTLVDWELLIVDDGSTDNTPMLLEPYLDDSRIRHWRFERNRGMGVALNLALNEARAPLIGYLPSDDVYYPEHLQTLVDHLAAHPEAVLAFAGMRYKYNRSVVGRVPGQALQLVQVLHRRVPERWIERSELVTDDLHRMLWAKLQNRGAFVGTGQLTCEWVDHPDQRHKIIREPLGGLNSYRARYGPSEPLRFHTSLGNAIDEVRHYRQFRERPDTPMAADGLKILLVGELAYNPERVLALEERGHKLYGLWTPDPYWFNTVGPLPFGHVQDLPRDSWREAVREIQPDIIYAQLNWQAVPFVHRIMTENPGIPFVWHFKEGPFICLEHGCWRELVELYTRADGQIYSSPELRDWFETVVPGLTRQAPAMVLDGDLPKREWFAAERSPRLFERDGAIHTVVPGRPIGLHPWVLADLAQQDIHVHFYGDYMQGVWKSWITKANRVAPGYLHLHPNVDQDRWVSEFSQYDAGWLHLFESGNGGNMHRAIWDDLNYPARIATLLTAGLPMLQSDNTGSIVAMQSLARDHDVGIFFSTAEQLRAQLDDDRHMTRLRDNAWRVREQFTFDYHADRLVAFFSAGDRWATVSNRREQQAENGAV